MTVVLTNNVGTRDKNGVEVACDLRAFCCIGQELGDGQ